MPLTSFKSRERFDLERPRIICPESFPDGLCSSENLECVRLSTLRLSTNLQNLFKRVSSFALSIASGEVTVPAEDP